MARLESGVRAIAVCAALAAGCSSSGLATVDAGAAPPDAVVIAADAASIAEPDAGVDAGARVRCEEPREVVRASTVWPRSLHVRADGTFGIEWFEGDDAGNYTTRLQVVDGTGAPLLDEPTDVQNGSLLAIDDGLVSHRPDGTLWILDREGRTIRPLIAEPTLMQFLSAHGTRVRGAFLDPASVDVQRWLGWVLDTSEPDAEPVIDGPGDTWSVRVLGQDGDRQLVLDVDRRALVDRGTISHDVISERAWEEREYTVPIAAVRHESAWVLLASEDVPELFGPRPIVIVVPDDPSLPWRRVSVELPEYMRSIGGTIAVGDGRAGVMVSRSGGDAFYIFVDLATMELGPRHVLEGIDSGQLAWDAAAASFVLVTHGDVTERPSLTFHCGITPDGIEPPGRRR